MSKLTNIDEQLKRMEEELNLQETVTEDTPEVTEEPVVEEKPKKKKTVSRKKKSVKTNSEDNTEESGNNEENDDYVILDEEGDPDRELFEGGPLVSDINKWKEEFGEVFATSIDMEMFLWRPLRRKDYKEIIETGGSIYDKEERYCAKCILWPENYDFKSESIKAGLPTVLAEQILIKSGFQPDYTPIQL